MLVNGQVLVGQINKFNIIQIILVMVFYMIQCIYKVTKIPLRDFKNASLCEICVVLFVDSQRKGGQVGLITPLGTHAYYVVWLIESSASFHMTSHGKWFCEYKNYNPVDVFLGYESKTKIIGHRVVKLLLKYERITNLLGILHIIYLEKTLKYVSKMGDASVYFVFERGTCEMVQGEMELMLIC